MIVKPKPTAAPIRQYSYTFLGLKISIAIIRTIPLNISSGRPAPKNAPNIDPSTAGSFATNSCVVALPKYNFIPVKPEISKVAIPKAIGTKAITHPIGLGISLLIIL